MANEKNSSIKSKKKKSHLIGFPQLRVMCTRVQQTAVGGRADNKETWALLWKTKCDRRETIVLVCLLSPECDREIDGYQKTIDKLKIEAKKSGCTCLTDMLQIVKMVEGYQDQQFWWHQFFDNNQLSDNIRYQLLRFGLDTDGKKNYSHYSFKLGNNTEWSLILHLMNNCSFIEEIVRSGRVPDSTFDNLLKFSPNNSTSIINDRFLNYDNEQMKSPPWLLLSPLSLWIKKFFSDYSMTVIHFRNLKSTCLSFIAVVRCMQVYLSIRKCIGNTKELSQSNISHHCNQGSKSNSIPSQIQLSKERVEKWNTFLSTLFDMLSGYLMSAALLFLFYNQRSFIKVFNLYVNRKSFQYLEDHIAWLETFPGGFKLNVQLTHAMGHGIRSLLNHHKRFLLATVWDPLLCQDFVVPTLAMVAALGGWTTFLALLVDLLRLEIIHVTFLAVCFRKLYQAELYLLSALFRLFRGKKLNVLRQRTDSMKYDAMQLLVGTIAFCVCVFLWTTIMVYYIFFVICNFLMHLPLVGCSVLYILSRSIPFGSLLVRFLDPSWFHDDLHIKMNDEIKMNSKISVQVGEIKSVLKSSTRILLDRIENPLKRLFNWYLISFLEILYPRANHKSLPLTMIVDAK